MEAGDLFVVSKGDLPGADAAAATLKSVVELRSGNAPPPVFVVSASQGIGIAELSAELKRTVAARHGSGDLATRRRERLARRIRHLALRELEPRLAAAANAAAAKGGAPQLLAREVQEQLRKS